jgi:hypothetical protein
MEPQRFLNRRGSDESLHPPLRGGREARGEPVFSEQIGERGFEAIRVADILVHLHPQRWVALSLQQPPDDAEAFFQHPKREHDRFARRLCVQRLDPVVAVAMNHRGAYAVRSRTALGAGSA